MCIIDIHVWHLRTNFYLDIVDLVCIIYEYVKIIARTVQTITRFLILLQRSVEKNKSNKLTIEKVSSSKHSQASDIKYTVRIKP